MLARGAVVLEGEGAHSPPSDTIILQLSTLKKIREKKTISTRHDVEPLGVHIATGGGPLPSSNKSVRPCAALPTFITNTAPHVPSLRPLRPRRHHVQRIELMGGRPSRPARASYRPVKVVQRRRPPGSRRTTLTGRWGVRGGLGGRPLWYEETPRRRKTARDRPGRRTRRRRREGWIRVSEISLILPRPVYRAPARIHGSPTTPARPAATASSRRPPPSAPSPSPPSASRTSASSPTPPTSSASPSTARCPAAARSTSSPPSANTRTPWPPPASCRAPSSACCCTARSSSTRPKPRSRRPRRSSTPSAAAPPRCKPPWRPSRAPPKRRRAAKVKAA